MSTSEPRSCIPYLQIPDQPQPYISYAFQKLKSALQLLPTEELLSDEFRDGLARLALLAQLGIWWQIVTSRAAADLHNTHGVHRPPKCKADTSLLC